MKRIVILFLIVTITQSIFGQMQNLGLNLNIGETYYHSMQASNIMTQVINGKRNTSNTAISDRIAFKVIDLQDTVYTMTASFEWLAVTMKFPDGDLTYASDKEEENDIFSPLLRAVIDKQFSVKMTKLGKIVEVKNLDSIFENVIDQSTNLSLQQKQETKESLVISYGDEAFKKGCEMVTNIYSNSTVEKGSTWTINTKSEAGIIANSIITYEFKDKIDNYNLIIGNGKFETLDKDTYVEKEGMPTRYNLTATMNSTLKVDVNTGWILEAKVNKLLSGNVEIKDNPDLPGGLLIPGSFENIISYSSK